MENMYSCKVSWEWWFKQDASSTSRVPGTSCTRLNREQSLQELRASSMSIMTAGKDSHHNHRYTFILCSALPTQLLAHQSILWLEIMSTVICLAHSSTATVSEAVALHALGWCILRFPCYSKIYTRAQTCSNQLFLSRPKFSLHRAKLLDSCMWCECQPGHIFAADIRKTFISCSWLAIHPFNAWSCIFCQ